MKFVRKDENLTIYKSDVFNIVQKAAADKNGINATAGCLYGENGEIYTFKSVYEQEKKILEELKL